MDFAEDVLEKKVEKLEENIKDVDVMIRDIYEYHIDSNYVLGKLGEEEGRSRRNNLRINGINKEKGKTWEMCKTKIKNIFQEKLEIQDNIIIERTHRTKGKTTRNNTARTNQPIIIVVNLPTIKIKAWFWEMFINLKEVTFL